MLTSAKKNASPLMVFIAFATVYLVWGSTYFFIQKAIEDIPAFLLGALRFTIAGILLMSWCIIKGERILVWQSVKYAAISGFLLLFIGTGAVIWAEQSLPSSLVAVLVSSSPVWFVLLDKPKWKENFSSAGIVLGLIVGFIGVILLFSEKVTTAFSATGSSSEVTGLIILVIGSISWAGGSLYSKYKSSGSSIVNSAWQMLAAGIAFLPGSLLSNEWSGFQWQSVSPSSWFSLAYLVVMGSIAGYSAYVWLLKVRPATQVSTYAYVNPVVAVLLGVFLAEEQMTLLQIVGLGVILVSVLLINIAKYRKESSPAKELKQPDGQTKITMPAGKEEQVCNV